MSGDPPSRGTLIVETVIATFIVALADLFGLALTVLGCGESGKPFCPIAKGERDPVLLCLVALLPVALVLAAGTWSVRHRDRRGLRYGLVGSVLVSLVLPVFLSVL